jgi:hypothetical protein
MIAMAHPRLDDVRMRYNSRCGYCGVTERETGGELTVDHYHPLCIGSDESDDNLVYCCFRCNSYKGEFEPTAEDIRQGFRVIHPLLDEVALHMGENQQTGRVEPLTNMGRFHIALSHLNRPQLVEQRLARRLHELIAESCRLLQDENEHVRLQIVMLEHYAEELLKRGDDKCKPGDE